MAQTIYTPAQERQKTFRDFISDPKRIRAIEKVAPQHLSPERLVNLASNAVLRTPALLECDLMTIYAAIIQAGELGIEPNTALQLAFLVPFNDFKNSRKVCQLIIGYRGLINLSYRSGQVTAADAHAVYQGEEFDVLFGTARKIHHKPNFTSAETLENLTHTYSVFETKAGGVVFDAMGKEQILTHKNKNSKQPNSGVWKDHPIPMCIKTPVRRCVKFVPMSAELSKGIALEDAHDTGDYSGLEFSLPEANPDQMSEENESTGAVSRLRDKVGTTTGPIIDPIPDDADRYDEHGNERETLL